jgi:hypothetical protein
LQVLEECKQNRFVALLTCHESWFFLECPGPGSKAASREEVPEKCKQQLIQKILELSDLGCQ